MKGVLIDFNDSFTYNIVSEFFNLNLELDVISICDVDDKCLSYDFFVWGPGPGLLNDYKDYYPTLRAIFDSEKPLMGICLGHQFIWSILGAEIKTAKQISHALVEKVKIDHMKELRNYLKYDVVEAQRYNSNAVYSINSSDSGISVAFNEHDELMISYGSNFVSYQFHPESIGTKDSDKLLGFFIENYLSE